MLPEPSVAPIIALRSVIHVMTYSINLDREMRLGAVEVQHVWTNRMLTTKHWHSWLAPTQAAP